MKIKTHKAVSKRFKVSKNGKVLKRHCGQDHFNSREPGKTTRNKRRDQSLKIFDSTVRTLIAKGKE